MIKDFLQQQEERKKSCINQFSNNIKIILNRLKAQGLSVTEANLKYSDKIGLTLELENIALILSPELDLDDDGLIKCEQLEKLFEKKFKEGYYHSNNYMLMLTPFLRRGMHHENNWAPLFVMKFWKLNFNKMKASIRLDYDRIKIDVDDSILVELDTWFGAPFKKEITNIKDGISKLRPPLDIEEMDLNPIFNHKYSLDIKWSTKGNIKTFQALEFSNEDIIVRNKEEIYHPVKYIHAEFDIEKNIFRHFDGAIHLYTPEEYRSRKDSDFNYSYKNNQSTKAKSKKIFRLDGEIPKDIYLDLTCHFFTGNPLILEYFTGSYPQHVTEYLNRIRKKRSNLKNPSI